MNELNNERTHGWLNLFHKGSGKNSRSFNIWPYLARDGILLKMLVNLLYIDDHTIERRRGAG